MKTDMASLIIAYIKLRESAATVIHEMHDEADDNPDIEATLIDWINELSAALELPGGIQ